MAMVPDRVVAAELDRSLRTLDRWDRGQEGTPPGWPRPIKFNRRKYRDADAFKAFMDGLRGKLANGGAS